MKSIEVKRGMAEITNWVTTRNLNTLTHPSWTVTATATATSKACSRRVDQDLSLTSRKNKKNRKRLVKISTSSDGKWSDKWNTHYTFSLRELQLQDLALRNDQQQDNDTQVSISLHVQQHASFGLSVDGKIISYFTTKCSICSSSYCRKIDTDFNVLILSANRRNEHTQLPDIGGDDQVIYVKPGYEADLDSLIQDTIRLATSVKDTCSESCEKSAPKIQYVGDKKSSAYIDPRWSRLLQLRNTFQK